MNLVKREQRKTRGQKLIKTRGEGKPVQKRWKSRKREKEQTKGVKIYLKV